LKSVLRRLLVPVVMLSAVSLVLTGCSSAPPSITAAADGGNSDGEVTITGSLTGQDAVRLEQSLADWSMSSQIRVVYKGSKNFEETIGTEAQKGNAPDLALFEQPGLLNDLATRGYLKALPSSVKSNISANFSQEWASYTTDKGVDYGIPLMATLNGWVWYSPKQFAQWGVTPPTTYGELTALTQRIQAVSGMAPWCEGFSSGASSGAAGTDWIDDMVLREDGTDVYDKWIAHKIPFTDSRIKSVFTDVASLLQNPKFVNQAGGVASIDTTTDAQVAAGLKSGTCALAHRPSSFDSVLQGSGSSVSFSPSGDYWAFMLPSTTADTVAVTGGGDFVAAFSADPETVKVEQYLSSTDWAKDRVRIGGVISPNKHVSATGASSPLLQQSVTLLQNPKTTFRFDASDLMPSIVGSGTYLTGMVNWMKGEPTAKVLSDIESSWPQN
jgi:alpha-glucoside transport system substrate-binding protein